MFAGFGSGVAAIAESCLVRFWFLALFSSSSEVSSLIFDLRRAESCSFMAAGFGSGETFVAAEVESILFCRVWIFLLRSACASL